MQVLQCNKVLFGGYMNQYLIVSFQAVVLFPIVVAVFTLPYIAYNYHKYGSILSLKVLIVYSFIFYLLCMYCLVILPLPSPEKAATLHSHKMQLEPFLFIKDIIKKAHVIPSEPKTWLTIVLNKAFLVNILNLFLAVPFGMYLRYYFKKSFSHTFILSLLLSLFFEITQLTGLYFIYSGSYRLFDVDDLIVNTLGGILGYAIVGPLMIILPSRDELDEVSYKRGMEISLFRRVVSFFFDMAFISIITILSRPLMHQFHILRAFEIVTLSYFSVLPILTKGSTLGNFITSTAIVSTKGGHPKFFAYFLRYFLFFGIYLYLPMYIRQALENFILINTDASKDMGYATIELLVALLYFLFLLLTTIKAALHRSLFYERWSRTKIESTVQVQ